MTRLLRLAAISVALMMIVATPAAAGSHRGHDGHRDDHRSGHHRNRADRVESVRELRKAIDDANDSGEHVRIELKRTHFRIDGGTDGDDYDITTGDLDITGNITIDGNGARIDGRGVDRIFDVGNGARLKLKHVRLVNGSPEETASGGAIRSAGELTIKRSIISDSTVRGDGASGGAIFNDGGQLKVYRSALVGNQSTRAGGAIEANAGITKVVRSTLDRNRTGDGPGNGGGLHLTGAGTVDVVGSSVTRNTAAAEGGGLWNSADGTMTVTGTYLSRNVASGDMATNGGGALYNDGGTLTVEHSKIDRNTADGESGSGGGILNNLGTLNVKGTKISRNRSNRAGGGIEANEGQTTLNHVSLYRNRTGDNPGNGGGLHLTGDGTVDIDDSSVVRNRAAAEGGGLWNSADGTMTVTDTRIRRNRAPVGPNVFNDGGTFTIDGDQVPVGG